MPFNYVIRNGLQWKPSPSVWQALHPRNFNRRTAFSLNLLIVNSRIDLMQGTRERMQDYLLPSRSTDMLNHSLVTKVKQQIAKAREPIFWLPLFEPGGPPLADEKKTRFSDACGKLFADMKQAKIDAMMEAIDVRHAFFKEMEALGIEGYVRLMEAINRGDPRADCAITKGDEWR
jgi:hypothetical protein